jgi:hypothetical protein
MTDNDADTNLKQLFGDDTAFFFLKPRDDQVQLAKLLGLHLGEGCAGMLLATGHVMTSVGRGELRKVAQQVGVELGDTDYERWPDNPRCLNRAIAAGILMLQALRSKEAEFVSEDENEEAHEVVKELIDHLLRAPQLLPWGTDIKILAPLLFPILFRSVSCGHR